MKLMKKNGGFTLVELIVVIAILAILAGIAVPAYSGYIKKAEKAGDLQLLGAINEAFAASCVASGAPVTNVSSASLTWENKCVTGVATVSGTGIDADECKSNFQLLFAGNTATQFKAIESLVFDTNLKVFVDPTTVTSLTVGYGSGQITISGGTISTMKDSTFGSVMGGEKLLDEVTGLTNMISAGGSQMADDLLGNVEYMKAYAEYMGVDVSAYSTVEEMKEAVGEKIAEIAIANGKDGENLESWYEDTVEDALVNGMVFYAAEGMKDYTVDKANNLLNSGDIYNNLNSDPATRLAEASLVYGMYAGFVNSEFNTGDAEGKKAESVTSNPMSAIQSVSGNGAHSANFQAYLDSPQGQADVKAYMEAMNVINDASGNDAAASVLVNGFADSELESLLTQVLGK